MHQFNIENNTLNTYKLKKQKHLIWNKNNNLRKQHAENVKVTVHVQITRDTSIYHSYFLCNIFWKKPISKFPGEYSLNVSNQLEYTTSACCFLKLLFLFQILHKKYEW
jgi:hypothetical protein